MWKVAAFLAVVALASAETASFENYKVYSVVPQTEQQLRILQRLEDEAGDFNFWKDPTQVNVPADIMVAPSKIPAFLDIVRAAGIHHETFIENVQALIDNQRATLANYGFSHNKYNTLADIYALLDDLANANPGRVQVINAGRSYEGRVIKGVKVSFGANKPGIFLEGGMHAREWISPATVMYILDQLLVSRDPEVRQLAESHDWYIFPVFNPDGYVYTHIGNRLWRKTRKPYNMFCVGSDPNRNWGYKWMAGGASNNPCTETYAGSAPFSDSETSSMARFITSIADKFYAYIAFHSYSQVLVFPYGHTRAHLDNYNESLLMGQRATQALARRFGTTYRTGNVAEIIYIASGSSVDWVKGTLRKPVTYTYELRDKGRHGFLLPPDQIIPTGQETLDSLVAMFKAAKELGYPNARNTGSRIVG